MLSLGSMALSQVNSQNQRMWNEDMMRLQHQWDLEMWNKTNEYNKPVNQIKRMQEAGLNPLYYGLDGSSAQGLQNAQPLGYQIPNMSAFQNPSIVGLQAEQARANIENTRADTALKSNQTESEIARKEQIMAETDKVRQSIENMIAEKELTTEQVNELRKAISWMDRLNSVAVASASAQTSFTKEQEARMKALVPKELLKTDAEISEINKGMEEMDTRIKKMVKETELTEEDIYWYTLTHMDSGILGTGFSVKNIATAGAQKEREIKDARSSGYGGSR